MGKVKPLLAVKADMDNIQFPALATPKLDGIRCLMVDGVAMSRTMKPIPNLHIQEQLKGLHGLDGELMVDGDYNAVQSAVMRREGTPKFTYCVFDSFVLGGGYGDRVKGLMYCPTLNPHIEVIAPVLLSSLGELDEYTDNCLSLGYEGVMIRAPNGPYKFGRSTVKEGILLKVKRFLDDEATLVGFTEKLHNGNELGVNELGYAKRSSCKGNLIPAGTAGACTLNWNGVEFSVGFGPGITDAVKLDWWNRRSELEGQRVTFRYQELSKEGIPRFGKVVGFRTDL